MLFKGTEITFDSPQIMGILNVTPDSFSDGGKFTSASSALKHALDMVNSGATFIDVGGESTRPGAKELSVQEELDRVLPVVELLNAELDTIISIDTSKPQVMLAAVEAGASLINDVRALSVPNALETAAHLAKSHGVPSCIMHMQGSPQNMQEAPEYNDVVAEIVAFFEKRLAQLIKAGFSSEQIIIDPGFGFGKTLGHNYAILNHLRQFTDLGLPVLAGMSRKSMIGNVINKPVDERLAGDIAASTIAAINGANIIRVHDVQQTADAMKIVQMVSKFNK
ncbi:dihydropteroate synthase [Glaciecola sp. 2405UD65-10]|uniref:dihydropteroate synthase n=1 Tax=Glaciecola sp. 2405UD65-10 TaxID=3397244 RepID=UPI003B5A7323